MKEKDIAKKIKERAFKGPHLIISSFDLKEIDAIGEYINENSLKKIASIIGPFSIINGTTEFDIPAFLRRKPYDLNPQEYILRLVAPENFYVSEIYITKKRIRQRMLVNRRECDGYFKYEYIYDGDKCVKIEKIRTRDPLLISLW